jgi:acyl carrier protein
MSLAEIGLDSKDLLLLDFQLEENDGLNIRFDDLREDMTVTEVARHIKKVTE